MWMWCLISPMQNPQADHCRLQEVGMYCQESRRLHQWVPELVLQERWMAWRPPHQQTHELQILMSWRIWCSSSRDGLEWPQISCTDWTRDFLSVNSETVEDLFLWSVCLQKIPPQKQVPIQATVVFTQLVKQNSSFYFVLMATQNVLWGCHVNGKGEIVALKRKLPHPSLYLEYLYFKGQECCSSETMPNIPVYSAIGES